MFWRMMLRLLVSDTVAFKKVWRFVEHVELWRWVRILGFPELKCYHTQLMWPEGFRSWCSDAICRTSQRLLVLGKASASLLCRHGLRPKIFHRDVKPPNIMCLGSLGALGSGLVGGSWVTSSNGRGCPILMASGPLLEPSWLTSEWPRCHVSNARCLCSMFHHLRKAHIQYLGIIYYIFIYIYIRIWVCVFIYLSIYLLFFWLI